MNTQTQEFTLRAMAQNYTDGHIWDHLDTEACLKAADEIRDLRRELASSTGQLNAIVDAWEALPGGRQVKNTDVEWWLGKYMGPGIDAIRGFLRRRRPDGVVPPPPSQTMKLA